jgi:hypothetical protein
MCCGISKMLCIGIGSVEKMWTAAVGTINNILVLCNDGMLEHVLLQF